MLIVENATTDKLLEVCLQTNQYVNGLKQSLDCETFLQRRLEHTLIPRADQLGRTADSKNPGRVHERGPKKCKSKNEMKFNTCILLRNLIFCLYRHFRYRPEYMRSEDESRPTCFFLRHFLYFVLDSCIIMIFIRLLLRCILCEYYSDFFAPGPPSGDDRP